MLFRAMDPSALPQSRLRQLCGLRILVAALVAMDLLQSVPAVWLTHLFALLAAVVQKHCISMPLSFLMLGVLEREVTWPMLRFQTDAYVTLQNEAAVVSAALLLLSLFCAIAVLQSWLTRAAGHRVQHRTSMIEPERPRLMSTTSAAELYYLRHDRSCAAAAIGSKGGHLGPSSILQICGISFIARFLQSLWQCCYITCLAPVVRLLQSICQKLLYHITLALKLVILLLAMLQSMLEIAQKLVSLWPSPLELAACFHLVSVPTHQGSNCIFCAIRTVVG